jgi:hypothetical protein
MFWLFTIQKMRKKSEFHLPQSKETKDFPRFKKDVSGQKILPDSVARWYIFIPIPPTLVYFGGPWNWKPLCIIRSFSIIYFHFVHFMAVWYILVSFCTFYWHLVEFVGIWCICSHKYVVPRKIRQPRCPELNRCIACDW